MATATRRRKYRYASRQEAENKVVECDQLAHQQLRLARALYTKGVTWAKTSRLGPYRVGAFDLQSPAGPRIVVVFAPGGQEPDLKVYDAGGGDWADYKRGLYRCYRQNDAEASQLAEAIQAVDLIVFKA